MNKKTFVSSADYRYFPMLVELVHSIQSFEQSKEFDICIFNAGMTVEQVKKLENFGCFVVEPQWPCDLPKRKIKNKEYLKSCVCRPFIPDYFPNYELYFWLDADTWIQKWESLELYITGAQRNKIAIASQADRSYERQYRFKWLGSIPIKIRGFYFSNAKIAYGSKKAKELSPYPVLIANAFAIKKILHTGKDGKKFY